jgi:hypothetical protein
VQSMFRVPTASVDMVGNLIVNLTPIFDTSALINLCRNDDSLDSIVKRLRPFMSSHGCPLSFISTIELFRGLSKCNLQRVNETLKPLLLAARISRRKVLRVPLTFARWELFRDEEAFRHQPRLLVAWLEQIQNPSFAARFSAGEIQLDFESMKQIFRKIETEEHLSTQAMLDKWHPEWREERRSGSALPEELRERANRAMRFEALKDELPSLFLEQMNIEATPANLDKARTHCDAYFTFQVNRTRASMIGNYNFESKPTDFHDWLQLLYLTRPLFCLVMDDRSTLERTRQSSQRSRIMSLNEFLSVERHVHL